MFGLGLGLGIHRHSNANPYAFPFISRTEADGGIVRDKAALFNLTNYLQSMMPNTKLLYCPELGVKLRTSGVNNYVTKLYDISPMLNDGVQTTALNQPYLSGNIAPNERFLIKTADNSDSYLNHDVISFSSSDKWSITTVIKSTGSKDWQFYLGGFAGKCRIGLAHPSLGYNFRYYNDLSETIGPTRTNHDLVGKTVVFTCVANGNNSLRIFLNGVLLGTYSINTASTIKGLLNDVAAYSSYQFKGAIAYHAIRSTELDVVQVQQEYNYLRSLFPEIENVKIGDQYWATSNCEMTCTPQGNVIQEMQAASNVEKITNAADREFTSDTGFWTKGTGWTIDGGTATRTGSGGTAIYRSDIYATAGKYYKITYTISSTFTTAIYARYGAVNGMTRKDVGTYTEYIKAVGTGSIEFWGTGSGSIDNVSVQEVGWSDSTNLYNYIYANTSGTAEQKEYAAVKAAAMWCYYNNDPALGAVYGKLYNWYAVRLLQMDIDYYNAANPTTPWGWRVPSSTDYITLSSTLGNTDISGAFLKKEGSSYWNLPNTNANNQSRFTAIGTGRRAINGTFEELNNLFNTHNSDKSRTAISNSSESIAFQGGADPILGMGLRLIKDESVANDTLHGFEYTPGQNDDIVTFIGNSVHNTNKTIQSMMTPFEELISTKERFNLQTDVTKRVDGTPSYLTDPNYLQKVSIPEFWYGARFDSVRNKVQVWFSLVPVPGFMHIAPQAICRYPGYIDGAGKARSHSGFKYPNNKNLIEFTAACQLTSTDLFVLPYYTYNALALLLSHDIGRRNAQAVWAGLQGGYTYSNITSGKTDVLVTPSGEVPADAETASNKPFRWRFIENLYGDCWKMLSGVYCNQVGAERRVMVCPDPYKANTNSVISADYIQACITAANEGWVKDINAPWINAKVYGATSTTGFGDYTYSGTTDKTIMVAGGASGFGALAGPFCLRSYASSLNQGVDLGALFASIDRLPAATQVVVPSLIY